MGRLRYLTAGESHGPALVAILEGLPAGLPVSTTAIESELARRRHGYGRGPRMKVERDELEILSGVRAGKTLGSPVALVVRNSEWAKWAHVMPIEGEVGGRPLTRPRPGHADLPGMLKYDFEDARDVLRVCTQYELRDQLTDGAVNTVATVPCPDPAVHYNRGKVFVTTDGTSVTFVSDDDITEPVATYDPTASPWEPPYPSGYLLMPDGTRYRIDDGAV